MAHQAIPVEVHAYIMSHQEHLRPQIFEQIQLEMAGSAPPLHGQRIYARRQTPASSAFVPHLFDTVPKKLFGPPRPTSAFRTPTRGPRTPLTPPAPHKPRTFEEFQAIDCPWQEQNLPCRYPVKHRPERGGLGCWHRHKPIEVEAPLAPPAPVAAVIKEEATPLPLVAEAIVVEAPPAPLPVVEVIKEEATPLPLDAAASVDEASPRKVIVSRFSMKPKPEVPQATPAPSAEDKPAKRAAEKPANKQPRHVQSAPVPLIEVSCFADIPKGSCSKFAGGGCVAGRCPKNYRHDHVVVRPQAAHRAAHRAAPPVARVPAPPRVCEDLKATGRQCGPHCKRLHDPNHVRPRDLVWVPDDNRSPDTDQVIFIRRCEVVGELHKGSCRTFATTGECRNRECSYRHTQILP
jgi:hypothetical protein